MSQAGEPRPASQPVTAASRQGTASAADRLERLPFSRFHRSFLLMVTAGEFVETMMLLGNGVVLAMVAGVLGFSSLVSTWVIPVAFFGGEFVGSLASGYVADRLGRKTVFLYDLLLFGLGMLIGGFMSTAFLIGLFVFIAGVGVGGEYPIVDTYTAEMFPGATRGRRMATVYTIAVLAAPIIAGLAYAVSTPSPGPYSWRILFWIMGVAGLIVWVIRFRVPESPRWLESRGRTDEAAEVISGIEDRVARDHDPDGWDPPRQPESGEVAVAQQSRWLDIFAPDLRRRTIMMLVFQFFQSGIFYGFVSLAPEFLLHKGISLVHSLLFSFIIYAGFFVGSVCNVFIIDRIERKWGIVGCAIIAGIFGTAFAVVANDVATVVLGFLTTFVLWQFSNFLHTYQAEIFPTRVRSTAAGTVYSVSRISTSLIVLTITTVFLPHGLIATFAVIWVFIIIVAIDIGVFGPKVSQLRVERIAQ